MLSWLVATQVTLRTFENYSDRNIPHANHHHRELIDAFVAKDPHRAQKIMAEFLSAAHRVYAFNRNAAG